MGTRPGYTCRSHADTHADVASIFRNYNRIIDLRSIIERAEENRRADELQAEKEKRADEIHMAERADEIKIQIVQIVAAKEQAKIEAAKEQAKIQAAKDQAKIEAD